MKEKYSKLSILLFSSIVIIITSYCLWFTNIKILGNKVTRISIVIDNDKQIDTISKDQIYITDMDKENLIEILNEVKKGQEVINKKIDTNAFLDVANLSAFYGTLFTAIGIIAAVLGFIGWNNIENLKKKLDKFKEIEKQVMWLYKKKENAEWVKNYFDKEDRKGSTKSFTKSSGDDKRNIKKIASHVHAETTDDSWIKLIVAQDLVGDSEGKSYKTLVTNYKKAEKAYTYIENRDFFEKDTDILLRLYHLKGFLYWKWYKAIKKETYNKSDEVNDFFIKNVYCEKDGKNFCTDKLKECEHRYLLNEAKKAYEQVVKIQENVGPEVNLDETYGNLAIVLIETSKYVDEKETLLNDAKKNLEKITSSDKDFNYHWDMSRIDYYNSTKNSTKEIEKETIVNICKKAEKKGKENFFLDTLKEEVKEKHKDGKTGFPGNQELVDKIIEELSN